MSEKKALAIHLSAALLHLSAIGLAFFGAYRGDLILNAWAALWCVLTFLCHYTAVKGVFDG